MTGTNWARNVVFNARSVARPTSVSELQAAVAGSDRVRALGSAHSFNRIADTDGTQVTVAALRPEIEIDTAAARARVSAGLTYAQLAPRLEQAGLALPNLGSLPHISIAGACATGTHGSGNGNGNVATVVSAIEMVIASGDVVSLSRTGDLDRFDGTVVALGCLGVVTRMTLDLVPSFAVAQYVFDDLPDESVDEHLDEIFAGGYSVSVFTDFRRQKLWVKRLAADAPPGERWFGATAATEPRHPVPDLSADNTTEQLGVAGPWHERLPHFRPDHRPSSGRELQSEYLLPRHHAVAALRAVRALRTQLIPVLQVAEFRTVAADELWLSPSYRRETAAFHFTWVDDAAIVLPVVRALERGLAPFDPRPHWGKVFDMSPETVGAQYELIPAFRELIREFDPHGKFSNSFVEKYLAHDTGQSRRSASTSSTRA